MTKRAAGKFKRRERDDYATPAEAVFPLLKFLDPYEVVGEPCAGDGKLVATLEAFGIDVGLKSDITQGIDALTLTKFDANFCALFITNPPWRRSILHPLIIHLSDLLPTWLLFDADWMHTIQASPYLERCEKIVSVGRIKWMPGTKNTGFDNVAWYLFKKSNTGRPKFYGR